MSQKFIFSTGGCYNPQRDGDLDKYLEVHNGRSCFPLFHGIKWFYTLRDNGLFLPDFSVVRLMWNMGRGDEHFCLTQDYKLEGMQANYHSGRPGIHEPEAILTDENPPWEAFNLALSPLRRETGRRLIQEFKEK
jgi:hypothetical protein